jgi:hypothetical protein
LRLVVDNRGLVARLLLLDPTPLTLRPMAAFLQAARCLGPVGRHRLIAYKLDWQISGKTAVARSWVFSG